MSIIIPIHRRPGFFIISRNGITNHHKLRTLCSSSTMMMNSKHFSSNLPSQTKKMGELLSSVEVERRTSIPQLETSHSDLCFNRSQPPPADQELIQEGRIEFGQFVAREALLDEEYWTAAWLRAECHWEGQINQRYVDNYKRKFAEQEFNALKRLCKKQHNHKFACIVTVKKEERNANRTALKNVVGTLDLSIRYLLPEETFPGERVKAPIFCSIDRAGRSRYGYIANLCVAKSARRQGIAKNMLHFAINLSKSCEPELVFVHVYRNNRPALELYQKMGFQVLLLLAAHFNGVGFCLENRYSNRSPSCTMWQYDCFSIHNMPHHLVESGGAEVVERATGQLSKEQTYLLCFKY